MAVSDDQKKQFLGLLLEGVGKRRAAAAIGLTWLTVQRSLDADQEFLEAYHTIEGHKVDDVEAALFETAKKGNVEAQKFFLSNRARDEWQQMQRVEHTGVNGGPIMMAQAATVALREALTDPASRLAAIEYFDAELVPDDPAELPATRSSSSLEKDRFASELGLLGISGPLAPSESPDDHQPEDRSGDY